MPEPIEPNPSPASLSRRTFLTAAGVTVAVVSLPVLRASAAKQRPKEPDAPVDVGPLTDYGADGVTEKWAKSSASFFVIRRDGKLFAASSLCTHRWCTLDVRADDLYCKCHKSIFTKDGEVTDGPAKTSLPRFSIKVDDKGHVIVMPGTEFAEAHWDDPKSFIKV